MEVIDRHLVCVSRMLLQDILTFTLPWLADIDSYEVVTGLLRVSRPCDKYVARQPQGQLRTSGVCPGRRGGGRGGPADSVLWLCSTARATWNTLSCEPSLLADLLRMLLRLLLDGLQPLWPSPSTPKPVLPGAPGPGPSGRSRAGQRVPLGPVARRHAACPGPAALGSPTPWPPPPAGSAAGKLIKLRR